MSELQKFSEEKALNEVFSNVRPSVVGLQEYNKIKSYQSKYKNGKMGQKAIDKLLSQFGFSKTVFYTKDKPE